MSQSYKVFFKDRVIFLTDKIDTLLSGEFNAILKYANQNELKQFIENFEQKQHLKVGFIYHHDLDELLDNFALSFKYIEAAGGIVINSDDEFLAIERLGVYDLPKGKAEEGESPLTTAMREIEEECGITNLQNPVKLLATLHTYTMGDTKYLKKTHWFLFTTDGRQAPTPQTTENITTAQWMKIDDISTFLSNTYDSIKEVIAAFQETLK